MLKIFKYGSVVKLNHALKKFESKGYRVERIQIETPADIYYPETGAVVERTVFYVIVQTNISSV